MLYVYFLYIIAYYVILVYYCVCVYYMIYDIIPDNQVMVSDQPIEPRLLPFLADVEHHWEGVWVAGC